MKKETARTLMLVVGVLVLLAVIGLGSAVWFFANAIDVGEADEASAARELDRIRQQYAGVQPVLEIRDDEPLVMRRPADGAPRSRLSTLRIVHWDPDDGSFTRVDLPFWFLRLKAGPIELTSNQAAFGDGDIGLTVEDLERLGPTLVIDHEDERGSRIIMWTE